LFAYSRLNKFKRFGPFSIALTLVCMGRYEKVQANSKIKRYLYKVVFKLYVPFNC